MSSETIADPRAGVTLMLLLTYQILPGSSPMHGLRLEQELHT